MGAGVSANSPVPKLRPAASDSPMKSIHNRNIKAASPSSPIALFPSYGIKLSYWQEIIDGAGGRQSLVGKSTREVCEEIVVPLTKEEGTSYCKMLLKQQHHAVGIADIFVAHDWRYDFLHVLDSLLHHFRDRQDVVVWFDVFSINQNITEDRNIQWWKECFLAEITNIGHTVLVMPPWQVEEVTSFKCISCLFALYHSMHHKCKFDIALTKEDKAKLVHDLTYNSEQVLQGIQAKIDVVHSQSLRAEDKRVLFQLIEEDVGFNTINQTVYKRIREWMTQFLSDEYERLSSSTSSKGTISKRLFPGGVASTTSSTISTATQETTTEASKYDDLSLLYMQLAVAFMLVEGDRYNIALCMLREAQHRILETYGEAHPIALQCLHSIAKSYQQSGDCNLAEKAFLDCADLCKHTKGKDHPDNLKYFLALGDLYRTQGEEKKAEAYYTKCLQRTNELFGDLHPDNLLYMNRLALLYFQQLKDTNAEVLLNQCVNRAKLIYGESHASTIKVMDELAQIYSGQGKYEHALSLQRECYQKCLEVFGEIHVDSLAVLMNLSKLYDIIGQLEEAQSLYKQSLEISRSLLGEKNPYASSLQRSLSRLDKKLHRRQSEGGARRDAEENTAPVSPEASPNHHHHHKHQNQQDHSPTKQNRKILILS